MGGVVACILWFCLPESLSEHSNPRAVPVGLNPWEEVINPTHIIQYNAGTNIHNAFKSLRSLTHSI